MKKFKCTPLNELLDEKVINELFDNLEIELHQCHMNSYNFAKWLNNNGYNVKFIPCCGVYDDGEIAFSRPHNVVKVDDKYYDITSEYIIRNCDYITDNSEYCVCGELTVSEYYNICKEFNMWFTPFDHKYLGNNIYVRYENTKKIIVKGEELDNDEKKLIEFINSFN